ncbi:hypothetical protein BCV69DRAFT_170798 [Microstroma glucosiphilum]|uniref:Uncharacterized protein n=1 Tax=Pseudomicrostroma glucosiphilum TaxID=1684307 RepID=A0A316U9D8_9BASI|nr:hypothetical protein BCV69DRAFT_170798 [Pseudomicrostroma glucosiphilum]PWN21464.1 hypothetical protein BCV69DRAFT_170798 [Pseudomicrostroma glucosiphilum]
MEEGVSQMSLGSPSGPGTCSRGGIAGLNSRGGKGRGGGRAGMAKRNLASLAPGGLPGTDDGRSFGPRAGDVGTRSPANQQIHKEVAENTAGMSKLALLAQKRKAAAAAASQPAATLSPSKRSPETGAGIAATQAGVVAAGGSAAAMQSADAGRPSKLQALAQSGQPKQATPVSQTASPALPASGPPTDASGKPLSKLQQKALAAKQERERKEAQKRTAESGMQGGEGMDIDGSHNTVVSLEADSTPSRLLPGGLAELSLFPTRMSTPSAHPRRSEVGELLAQSTDLPQPDPSTFLSLVAGDEVSKAAFVEPSPDDKVVKARQGTKLGA